MNKSNAALNGEWGKVKKAVKKATNKKRCAAGKRAAQDR